MKRLFRTQEVLGLAKITERQLYYWMRSKLLWESSWRTKPRYRNWTLPQVLMIIGVAKRRNYKNPIDGEQMSVQEIRMHVPHLRKLVSKYDESTLLACNLIWYNTFRLAQRDYPLPRGAILLCNIESLVKR